MRGLLLLATLMATAISAFAQSPSLVGTWILTGADKILPDGKQVSDYGVDPMASSSLRPTAAML
jgi:hypothetical protein